MTARWGVADYYARQSEQIVGIWQKDLSLQTESSIREVIALDEQALSFAPRHRTYLYRLGQMHGALYRISRIRNRDDGPLSLQYLRDSIAVRPEWPLTWSELVLTKAAMGEYDAELHQAIVNSAKYGPWEPIVHHQLTRGGIGAYPQLPDKIQGVVRGNIQRGLVSREPGGPRRVTRAIYLASHGLTVDLVWDLGLHLAGIEWPSRSIQAMTELTLYLWPVFNADTRRLLTVKLSQAVVLDQGTGVLRKLRDAKQLGLVCPYLPREPRFTRFCGSARFIGR